MGHGRGIFTVWTIDMIKSRLLLRPSWATLSKLQHFLFLFHAIAVLLGIYCYLTSFLFYSLILLIVCLPH